MPQPPHGSTLVQVMALSINQQTLFHQLMLTKLLVPSGANVLILYVFNPILLWSRMELFLHFVWFVDTDLMKAVKIHSEEDMHQPTEFQYI